MVSPMVVCAALAMLATLVLVGVLFFERRHPVLPDWPCDMPDSSTILNTQPPFVGSADASVGLASCAPFARFSQDKRFSFLNTANAWMAAGLNMDFCPAALVVAAGECQPLGFPYDGSCDLVQTGQSGLWQTDWVATADVSKVGPDWAKRVLNPCENARYSYTYIVQPADSYDLGCFTGEDGKITAPQRVEPCDSKETCPANQDPNVGGWDFEYSKGRCNFLGPFCHWQVNRNFNLEAQGNLCTGPFCSCCAWTGGANENQPLGFPNYYQHKFMFRLAGVDPADSYPVDSYATAQAICAQATGVPVGEPTNA